MTTTTYSRTARVLHWGMALLIICLLALGFYMKDLPLSPDKLRLYSWHKWAGVTVFLLALARVGWRTFHRPPPLPSSMPAVARIAAGAAHLLLYLLMLAIPLSGWLMSSAKGFQTVWFGVLPLPDFMPVDKALAESIKPLHELFANALAVLVVLHVAGALKHQFIDRDGILNRMRLGSRR